MKKLLLSVSLLVASYAIKAQTFYPSGNPSTPTWGYDDVYGANGNFYNNSTGAEGDALDDAELDYYTYNRGDAYDGAFEFFVNTTDSVYTESGLLTGGVDTTGTTISAAEQLIDGLYVSKSYFFSPTTPVVRATFKIRNPTSTAVTTKIGIYANMGSDNSTVVDTSFTNGGASLTDADRWMVTTDSMPFDTGDPINTWVRFGPGSIQSSPIFGEKPGMGSDDYLDTFAISVPGNASVLILQFNRLDSTEAAARMNVTVFNSVTTMQSAGFLAGMTPTELLKVVNWDFTPLFVGVPELAKELNDVYVYPNPTSGSFTVKANSAAQVMITNALGQLILNEKTNDTTENFSIENEPNGIYFVKVISENAQKTFKLIKNK